MLQITSYQWRLIRWITIFTDVKLFYLYRATVQYDGNAQDIRRWGLNCLTLWLVTNAANVIKLASLTQALSWANGLLHWLRSDAIICVQLFALVGYIKQAVYLGADNVLARNLPVQDNHVS
jgi:hypothetical protein